MTLPNEKQMNNPKMAKPGDKRNSGLSVNEVIKIISSSADKDSSNKSTEETE